MVGPDAFAFKSQVEVCAAVALIYIWTLSLYIVVDSRSETEKNAEGLLDFPQSKVCVLRSS